MLSLVKGTFSNVKLAFITIAFIQTVLYLSLNSVLVKKLRTDETNDDINEVNLPVLELQ